MPTTQNQLDLIRNKTARRYFPPRKTDEQAELYRQQRSRGRVISLKTRQGRRIRAHLRFVAGVRGKAKHMKTFLNNTSGEYRMARPRSVLGEMMQTPYEARATAPRPWMTRARRRAANKRARIGRRNARRR